MCKIERPSNYLLIVPGITIIVFFLFVSRNDNATKKTKYYFLCAFCVLFTVLQFFAIKSYYFHAGWDVYYIEEVINSKIDNIPYSLEIVDYFSIYPNNLFLCSVYYLIEKLFIAIGFWYGNRHLAILFVNCFICQFCAFLTYWCTYHVSSNPKLPIISFILFQLLIGISPWFSITYSDSFGILFPILIFSLYILPTNSFFTKYGKWLVIGFLTFCGYSIKPQTCIVSIAIVLVCLVNYNYRNNIIDLLSKAILLFVGIVLSAEFVDKCISVLNMSIDTSKAFGLSHFFLIGMNASSGGMWNGDDLAFSLSLSSDVRSKVEISVALLRIKELGFSGFIKHLANKTLSTYNDGSFAWWKEGKFLAVLVPELSSRFCWTLRNLFYSDGIFNSYWYIICQIIWLPVLVSTIFLAFYKKLSLPTLIIELSLIGIFVYNLLFEARARYLLVNLPFFIIASAIGLDVINEKFLLLRQKLSISIKKEK